jgi:hypothetical protein
LAIVRAEAVRHDGHPLRALGAQPRQRHREALVRVDERRQVVADLGVPGSTGIWIESVDQPASASSVRSSPYRS